MDHINQTSITKDTEYLAIVSTCVFILNSLFYYYLIFLILIEICSQIISFLQLFFTEDTILLLLIGLQLSGRRTEKET